MSRMPPSLSGGLLCANAAVAATASTEAKTPERTRFIKTSLLMPRLLSRPLIPLPRSCRNARAAASSSATRQSCGRAVFAFSAKHGQELKCTRLRSGQKPFSWNMVELQPYFGGILEKQRIISRRPLILARRANDGHAERTQEAVQFINVGALAGAKTEMMQADAILLERSSAMLRRRRVDPDRGAPADAVKGCVAVDYRLHAEKRQQLAVEFSRAFKIGRGQKNMRDAVDFHLAPLRHQDDLG